MKKEYNVRWLNENYCGGAHWRSCWDQEKFRSAKFTLEEAQQKAEQLRSEGKKVRIYKANTMVVEMEARA